MKRHPMLSPIAAAHPLTKAEQDALTKETVSKVKMLDCAFYNACLTEAARLDWPGFGCSGCTAFALMDVEQRVQDVINLQGALFAAENLDKEGNAGRKYGVKPGVDAKLGKRRLRVVKDDEEEQAA
jgi:hypothetical protein